ncbi:hypothetical protein [Micromonospora sp. M61]|uniref:hypothetical protein n=1 Tax=Micromonospora sp. M61 TaxID=2824890 RepID=UPI001FFD3C79|nr:hypothetical protein [Micromonospora sp. M61]
MARRPSVRDLSEVLASQDGTAEHVREDGPLVVGQAFNAPEPTLRSLDAIHLATAQVLTNESGAELVAFVAYDRRLLDAAKAAGLATASPGQN